MTIVVENLSTLVMPALVAGIHVLLYRRARTWMAGHRRAEATPSFGRLCPAMTDVLWSCTQAKAGSRRLLPAAGIEPGVNAALKPRKRLQAFSVRERQQLHQDHAGDVARRIDPEVSVGEAR